MLKLKGQKDCGESLSKGNGRESRKLISRKRLIDCSIKHNEDRAIGLKANAKKRPPNPDSYRKDGLSLKQLFATFIVKMIL